MSAKGEVAASAADLIKDEADKPQPETEKSVELPSGLQFVCFPCKRGFFSEEQMLAHEQKSLNHKAILERLSIQQIKEEITSKASKAAMRDEVKKYRESLEQQKVIREDKLVRTAGPADTLGADSVGNKLLQKMGWTEGKGACAHGQFYLFPRSCVFFRIFTVTRSPLHRPRERRDGIQGAHQCRHEGGACWTGQWNGIDCIYCAVCNACGSLLMLTACCRALLSLVPT